MKLRLRRKMRERKCLNEESYQSKHFLSKKDEGKKYQTRYDEKAMSEGKVI